MTGRFEIQPAGVIGHPLADDGRIIAVFGCAVIAHDNKFWLFVAALIDGQMKPEAVFFHFLLVEDFQRNVFLPLDQITDRFFEIR